MAPEEFIDEHFDANATTEGADEEEWWEAERHHEAYMNELDEYFYRTDPVVKSLKRKLEEDLRKMGNSNE